VKELRALAAAFTFLTRVPLGRLASHNEGDLRSSAAYFPIVGTVVGGFGAIVYAAGNRLWPSSIAVLLSIAATVYLTGAFHEDALADTLDGFGGGRTTERILEIMKDSRVGSYALVGVALSLAVKFAALFSLAGSSGTSGVARALVAGHVFARWSSVPLMMTLSYVRVASTNARPSAGGPFSAGATLPRAFAATGFAAVAVIVALNAGDALLAGVVVILVTLVAGAWFKRRIGGITGDTLGAANQIVEISVYLAILAHR
jgi:adenosylcobinamide-GDP ribazoletransferase